MARIAPDVSRHGRDPALGVEWAGRLGRPSARTAGAAARAPFADLLRQVARREARPTAQPTGQEPEVQPTKAAAADPAAVEAGQAAAQAETGRDADGETAARPRAQGEEDAAPGDATPAAGAPAGPGASVALLAVGVPVEVAGDAGADPADAEAETSSAAADAPGAAWELLPARGGERAERGLTAQAVRGRMDGAGAQAEVDADASAGGLLPEASPEAEARANALDLLQPHEVAGGDVHVEGEGSQLMERLQQALATSDHGAVDALGEPIVPQVVRSLAALARNGVAEMRLQLQPPDLGHIELRVRATEGIVRGEVMVQNPEVKHLLDSQLERLRTALGEHGLQLAGFDVGVSDHGAFARDRDGTEDGDRRPSAADNLLRPERAPRAVADAVDPRAPRRPVRLDPDAVDWLV